MEDLIQNLGVGGIITLMVVKEFLAHLDSKKPEHVNKRMERLVADVSIIKSEIRDLHQWHDREDAEGVKIWNTRNKGLEDTLQRISENIEAQTKLLVKLLGRSN